MTLIGKSMNSIVKPLSLAAALTLSSITPFTSVWADDIIVIGAGLSGLTAAFELEKNGHDVIILEANTRVGGRMFTLYNHFEQGQFAEAGGELIDAAHVHKNLHAYVQKFGLQLEEVGYDHVDEGAYFLDGKLIPYEQLKKVMGQKVNREFNRFWDELATLGEQVNNPKMPHESINAAKLDAMTVSQWLDSLQLHPHARTLADQYITGEYDSPEALSALFLAQQVKTYANVEDEDVEIFRISGGNSRLPEAFVNNIAGSIKLNTPVTHIKQDANGVSVIANGDAFKADYAVVTTSLPAMRNISFSPELPAIKAKATQELNYGSHTKVMMQYSKRFWLDNNLGGDTASELPIGWTWEATDQQAGSTGILIAYISGKHADTNKFATEAEIISQMRAQIQQMYPNSKDLFVKAEVQAWHRETWTQGGYTAYGPGQVTQFWGVFTKPFSKVYFAGEHTDNLYPGYLEGAIRSGQRVAKQIGKKK
jgi:monoamine oxidase